MYVLQEGVKEATEEYEGTLMQMKMLLVNRADFSTLYGVVESIQVVSGNMQCRIHHVGAVHGNIQTRDC